ncbi:MAG: sulfurtransferase [Planctomycetota bacterium]|jgi:thiosulfate/3-mercaptopyruvate sulfurtransferase
MSYNRLNGTCQLNKKAKVYRHSLVGLIVFIIAATISGCSSNQYYESDLVTQGNELALQLNKNATEQLVILDVRSETEYDKGHIAGAVRIDPSEWKEQSLAAETGLDHETLWKNRIGAVGISGRDPILIYDDGTMTKATRIWFIFQHFGVPNTSVLNGGYPILKPLIKKGRIAISQERTKPTPAKFKYTANIAARVELVERQSVRKAIEHGEAQVFDTRTYEEYTGENLRNNTRGGHLPTAINLPHNKLLDKKGLLKSPQTLAAILKKAGFRRGQPIITHCEGGGRASLAALAAEIAGYGPVMNYYLSFGDWAADASCPIEKPAK